jgi:hypothetical protein
MKKHFTDIGEAQDFVDDLYKEEKWIIKATIGNNDEGGYNVEWQEHKKYTAFDGKEYFDEVWTTEQGEVIFIQDLSEAHARNILRMILRNECIQKEAYAGLLDKLQSAMMNVVNEKDSTESINESMPDVNDDKFTLPEGVFAVKGNTTLN